MFLSEEILNLIEQITINRDFYSLERALISVLTPYQIERGKDIPSFVKGYKSAMRIKKGYLAATEDKELVIFLVDGDKNIKIHFDRKDTQAVKKFVKSEL